MTEEATAERLAGEFAQLEIEELKLKRRKKELIEKAVAMVEKAPSAGVATVRGKMKQLKITFRENISYSDKGKLEDIVMGLPSNQQLFRIDFRERRSEVEKYITSGGQFAKQLEEIRVVRQGAPSVKIEVNR